MTPKTASDQCVDLIKHYEGCHLKAYPDPKTGGDPWTIGWGATGAGVLPGIEWTQQQADERLQDDIQERVEVVRQYINTPMSQGQFDALISLVFNVGYGHRRKDGILHLKNGSPSSLMRLLNAGQYHAARAEFAKWISPGSNVEYGLRRRRRAEQGLWDGLTAEEAIQVSEAEFPLKRK